MNYCFISGKIVSNLEFKFFFNSKKHVSKICFYTEIGNGFISLRNQKNTTILVIAYDNIADMLYRKFKKSDIIKFYGYLEKNNVIVQGLM